MAAYLRSQDLYRVCIAPRGFSAHGHWRNDVQAHANAVQCARTTDYVDDMILTAKAKLGVTSLVISHDVASAFKVADQIAFLAEGKIVAHAPPAEIRRSTHPAVKLFLSMWFGKN